MNPEKRKPEPGQEIELLPEALDLLPARIAVLMSTHPVFVDDEPLMMIFDEYAYPVWEVYARCKEEVWLIGIHWKYKSK